MRTTTSGIEKEKLLVTLSTWYDIYGRCFSYLGLLILLYVISSCEKTTFHLYNLYIISELNTFYPPLCLRERKGS